MSNRVSLKMFCVLLGLASVSCGEAKKVEVTDTPTAAPIALEPADAFIAAMEAYNRQDLTKLLSAFHKEVVWSNMTASSSKLSGRTTLANQLLAERGVFPDCSVGIETVLESEQKLAAVGVFKGTHRGPIHGFAATGKEVRYPFIYFLDMNQGQIASNVAYFNPVAAARQIGAVKAKSVRAATMPTGAPNIVRGVALPEVMGAARQLLAAMQKGDSEAMAALLVDNAVLIDPSLERFEGKEAVAGALARGSSAFEGLKIPVDQMVAAGSFVAVSLVLQGTFSFAGKDPPVRKALDIPGAMFVEVKEGKVASVQLITDEMQPFQQVGIPPKAAFAALGDGAGSEDTDSGAARAAAASAADKTIDPANAASH
ncbi:MAG: ester cyclase [Myxococcota bacterium]|jgi:steroid delta-isomerase-like uncharacterized protein|nr:ester cyclase [Myxococcota bacterium]